MKTEIINYSLFGVFLLDTQKSVSEHLSLVIKNVSPDYIVHL